MTDRLLRLALLGVVYVALFVLLIAALTKES